MNRPAGGGTPPSLADKIFALADHFGSPEERRLVKTQAAPLRAFLNHPSVNLGSRRTELDIGLENSLTLKFNLVASGPASPWVMVDQVGTWAPALRDLADVVLSRKLRCHVGIKVSRAGVEYEIYPYETDDGLIARRIGLADPAATRLPAPPYCYGFSSTGGISAYARIDQVPPEELEQVSGLRIGAEDQGTRALFHSRRDPGGAWSAGKAGIEFLPFPSYLLNSVLGQFNLRFAYLLHRGGSRPYGVVGLHGDRQVLYTTLVPRPPARAQTRGH